MAFSFLHLWNILRNLIIFFLFVPKFGEIIKQIRRK